MTRPTRITVNSGDNSWESQLNTNLQQIYDLPFPPLLHAGTLANLEASRPAAQYQWCIAVVDYDGAGTPGEHLAFSNGTAWKLASNWEFINRRTFRGITTTDAFADTDETIVVTGAASFVLTLPAITDANEGRVCRVKNNGTGTVTITPTGGDTIDGSPTKPSSTQYDAFEFISDGTSNWQIFGASGAGGGASSFLTLTDTPASYASQALKMARVNAGETALEFVTPDTFVSLPDTPANYTGAASKFVKVNSTPDALEFVTAAFPDLSDTPANYSGAASKTVRVNSGETALEFVDTAVGQPGGPLKHISRGHVAADADQGLVAFPGANILLPTEHSSAGAAVTWDSGNDWFLINEAGVYLILYELVTEDASTHNTYAIIKKDTGGGFNAIEESRGVSGSGTATTTSQHIVELLAVGDKIQLWGADLSAAAQVAREGTGMSLIKLEVSISGGGDMESFQQGLDASETYALTASMAAVDLQSSILNNATDLYTFTAGTDVLTLNSAGLYMISYTMVMDETSGTLETAAKLQKDIGAGFVDIDGSQSSGSGADQFTHGNTVLIELDATDEIKLMAQYTTSGGNAVAGTMLRVVRLKRGSDAIDYSTTTQDTGRKWIDGKTIWRKVVSSVGAVTAGSTQTFAHSIASIDRVVGFEGHMTRDDASSSHYPINYAQLGAEISATVNDTNLSIFLNSAYTGAGNVLSDPQFIIDYTI